MSFSSPPNTPHPKAGRQDPPLVEEASADSDPIQVQLDRATRSVDLAQRQATQEMTRSKELESKMERQQAQIDELKELLTQGREHRQRTVIEQREHTAERRTHAAKATRQEKAKEPMQQQPEEAHSRESSSPLMEPSPSPSLSPIREPQPPLRRSHPSTMEEILRRLDRMDSDRAYRPPQSFPRRQGPFAPHIRQTERPSTLKAPRMTPYVGESDPMLHMDAFEMATIAKGFSDGLLCLLFVETLGGQAINWFLSLEENSVASFEDLRNAFLRRFKLLTESTLSIAQLFHQQQ